MSLLERGQIAQLLIAVARSLRGGGAPGEGVSGLHAAEAVGDENGDCVGGGSKVIVKGRKFGFV